jgi:hypothetical protein
VTQNNTANQPEQIRDQIDAIRKNRMLSFEKWRDIGSILTADLKICGQFFTTEQGLFLFDSESLQALQLLKGEMVSRPSSTDAMASIQTKLASRGCWQIWRLKRT